MPEALQFKSQFLLSKHHLFLRTIEAMTVTFPQYPYFASRTPFFPSAPLLSHQTQFQEIFVCASKSRRGSGSQKLRKIVPKLVSFMASNLEIFPEPWDMFIEEFSGGDGGGLGFWKGFGGGDFDGWRRKGKRALGFLSVLAICVLGLLLSLSSSGRELKRDELLWLLAFGLIGALFTKGLKRGVKDWNFGVFLCGVVMGFGLRSEDLQKWFERHRVCSPVLALMKGKKKWQKISVRGNRNLLAILYSLIN